MTSNAPASTPCDCPDWQLCCRLRRHIHGHLWTYYQDRPEYRALWEREAADLPPLPGCEGIAAAVAGPAPAVAAVPTHGPGTELKLLLASLGAEACLTCLARVAQMNIWGAEGCRCHRDEIAGWLRDGAEAAGWAARLKAAALALATGLAFRLDPADPYGGLADEAIRRAEAAGR